MVKRMSRMEWKRKATTTRKKNKSFCVCSWCASDTRYGDAMLSRAGHSNFTHLTYLFASFLTGFQFFSFHSFIALLFRYGWPSHHHGCTQRASGWMVWRKIAIIALEMEWNRKMKIWATLRIGTHTRHDLRGTMNESAELLSSFSAMGKHFFLYSEQSEMMCDGQFI